MNRQVSIALLLALSACAGGDSRPAPSFVFTPDPELEALTEQWAARWSAARELDISVGAGSIPVVCPAFYPESGL